ncbi:MAG: histone deacetylase [Anaerolineae bacterium]
MTTAYVTHPRYVEHHLPEHPEHAGRIRAVWRRIDEDGLIAQLKLVEANRATREQVLQVHDAGYFELLERTSRMATTSRLDPDTYANPASFEVALLAAGGMVAAVDAILGGTADNALAVVRPPGHHALADRGMGFCLFNNAAIAARYAQQAYGIERVAIVDYDVHHGNGTNDIFYDDPTVLFISLHQYPLYPMQGLVREIGAGAGRGYTLNLPLPAGCGDKAYAQVFREVVVPVVTRFQPQLLIVSSGHDAHWMDPLAGMNLSLAGFAHLNAELNRMAKMTCSGHIIYGMEGGYNLDALGYGWRNIARQLLGLAPDDPLGPAPTSREPDIRAVLNQATTLLSLDSRAST